jgi:hypothetical protein
MKNKSYIDKAHTRGKIWSFLAIIVLFAVPVLICIHNKIAYNAPWPSFSDIFNKNIISVLAIYWISAIVEVITYTPMLGAGGTYLSFVTGNITNLKLPCGLNAMNAAKVKANSEEGEVISTISIGVSAIVTTVIIAVGVLVFGDTVEKLMAPGSALAPAFNNVTTALFGALFASYLGKYWKLTILPLIVGCVVLYFVPAFGVGTLLFVTIVASVAGVFLLNALGLLDKKSK